MLNDATGEEEEISLLFHLISTEKHLLTLCACTVDTNAETQKQHKHNKQKGKKKEGKIGSINLLYDR